jgi:hypothetical protein
MVCPGGMTTHTHTHTHTHTDDRLNNHSLHSNSNEKIVDPESEHTQNPSLIDSTKCLPAAPNSSWMIMNRSRRHFPRLCRGVVALLTQLLQKGLPASRIKYDVRTKNRRRATAQQNSLKSEGVRMESIAVAVSEMYCSAAVRAVNSSCTSACWHHPTVWWYT